MADIPLPTRMCVTGSSGSGKTRWLVRFLLERMVATGKITRVVWVAPKHSLEQGDVKALKRGCSDCITIDGSDGFSPEVQEKVFSAVSKKRRRDPETSKYDPDTFLVLDDMMSAGGAKSRKWLANAFTTYRHLGVSIAELTQNLFSNGAEGRTNRLQCQQFVLFKFASADAADDLFRQIEGRGGEALKRSRQLAKVYREEIDQPYGYLMLDITKKRDDPARYRPSSLDQGLVLD